MFLSELTKRLCTQDLYPFILQNKKKLAWTVRYSKAYDFEFDDEVVRSGAVGAVWKYIEKYGSAPSSVGAVRDYVVNNPDHLKEFSRDDQSGKDKAGGVVEQLEALIPWEPSVGSIKGMDTLVLLDTVFTKVRETFHKVCYTKASNIALGIDVYKWKDKDGMKEERGPSAAMRYLRYWWTKDYSEDTPPVEGMLHENIQVVREGFAEKLSDKTTSGRFPLGLGHIDSRVVVGRQNLRFIGIVGQAGDGKTTLMNFIIYNWLLQGAHGLYFSTEHTAKDIFEIMTYLHSSHPDYVEKGWVLPPPKMWEDRAVTSQDIQVMNEITEDIQSRRNLPGLLEVKHFPTRDWDTIRDWLVLNHAKNEYDFCAIDYITRLETLGDVRFKKQEMAALVHQMQKETRDFDDARGLILISPLVITKASYEEAKKVEKKEDGNDGASGHYDQNSIREYSELKDDMDLILTVWSDSDMKMKNEIEIGCVKKRKGIQPPAIMMHLTEEGCFVLGERTTVNTYTPNQGTAQDIRGIDGMVDQLGRY